MKSFALSRSTFISTMLLLFTAAMPLLFADSRPGMETPQAEVRQRFSDLPLLFEPNQGQVNGDVRFLSRVPGFSVLMKDREVELMTSSGSDLSVIRMRFVASRFAKDPIPLDRQQAVTNYLKGNSPSAWLTQIPNFRRVAYMGIYPGVDVFFYGDHSQFEHDFVVSPGADYHQIRVRMESAQRLSLRADGSLLLATSAGDLTFKAPQIYQLKNDRKVAIEGRFALRGPNEFGFELTLRRHS